MKTTVSSKGQIVLPSELRERDGIEAGQQFEIERLEKGQYLLKKVAAPGRPGLVGWLRSCPEQDWFTPLESESTDTLNRSDI
ncbi:MAG: AbrB/MazE/SpoVT family DNA-binding domain-containing protein [Planctomycetota bacterium]